MIGVCIVTYNQEQYIAQAIESVLMQEDCGHEVVIYIGEDNSTDKTGAICDEYVSRSLVRSFNPSFAIKVIHNEKNLGLVGNTMNLLEIMRKDGCDYIAMLDGDDYWTDPCKLQKQMACFGAHPDYGLIHTCVDTLYPDKLVADGRTSMQEGDVSSIIFGYRIGNCSVVFKTELLDHINFEEFQQQGFFSCDFIMYVIFSCYTRFGFMPDHTAVWRRGHNSVSNTNDMEKQINYVHNDMAMWRYASRLFPDRWTADDDEVEKYFHYRAFTNAFKYGDRKRALHEARLMGPAFRKQKRLKVLIAHSALLTYLWNWYKQS